MRNARNYLVYAIVLGLFAAGGTAWYITQAEAAANPTEQVIVAKTAIPARTLLTEDALTLKKLPKGAIHPESSSHMEDFIGKTSKQSMVAGEQMLASKLFRDRAESGLAFVLPEGHRAVAITVNELIAAGGLIVPGDKVDVIGSCLVDTKVGDKETQMARVVYSLQYLEVLAVAQDVVGQEAVPPQDLLRAQDAKTMLSVSRQPENKPTAKSITLALTPDESQKLILLENHPACSLRLALRAAGDTGKVTTGVVDFNPGTSMSPIVQP